MKTDKGIQFFLAAFQEITYVTLKFRASLSDHCVYFIFIVLRCDMIFIRHSIQFCLNISFQNQNLFMIFFYSWYFWYFIRRHCNGFVIGWQMNRYNIRTVEACILFVVLWRFWFKSCRYLYPWRRKKFKMVLTCIWLFKEMQWGCGINFQRFPTNNKRRLLWVRALKRKYIPKLNYARVFWFVVFISTWKQNASSLPYPLKEKQTKQTTKHGWLIQNLQVLEASWETNLFVWKKEIKRISYLWWSVISRVMMTKRTFIQVCRTASGSVHSKSTKVLFPDILKIGSEWAERISSAWKGWNIQKYVNVLQESFQNCAVVIDVLKFLLKNQRTYC